MTLAAPDIQSYGRTDFQSVAGAAEAKRIGVMLIISSLEAGGAERQVIELANNLDPARFEVTVCSLSRNIPLAEGLRDRDGQICVVERRRRYDLGVVPRVARLMRERRVQIAHGFLFDAEMVARLAGKLAGVRVILGSERNTDYHRPWTHRLSYRATRSFCDAIVANSEAGKLFDMRTLGVPAERIHVVRNAVDVRRFRRVDASLLRAELGIPAGDHVVGMVANFKRQKRHADFFEMARLVRQTIPNVWFVCAGDPLRDNLQGAEDYHREMRDIVTRDDLAERVLFLGRRADMPQVYSLCDVTVLTSSREGTPNVLLESMACEAPVVATNVSDNRHLVVDGQTGHLVQLGDVQSMARHVNDLLRDAALRRRMGIAAREWVTQAFSPERLAGKLANIYQSSLAEKRNRRAIA